MSNINDLIAAIRSYNPIDNSGDTKLITALKAYLKDFLPTSNEQASQILRPEPMCEGVDAGKCAELLEKCISGDNNRALECRNQLQTISATLNKGGLKNVNNVLARKVCKTLGIDYNSGNPVGEWLATLEKVSSADAKNIKENGSLMHIIRTFVASAKNVTQGKNDRSNLIVNLPSFTSTIQNGGGILANDTFLQYSDSIKTIVSMRGGAQPTLNKTSAELVLMYNRFVESLKSNNKKIDDNDDETIRRLLGQIKENEKKLEGIVLYIDRYNKLKNHPQLTAEDKALFDKNPVTVQLLEDLNKKYAEYSNKRQKNVEICINMFGSLNLASKHKSSSEQPFTVDVNKLVVKDNTAAPDSRFAVPTDSKFAVSSAKKYFSW